MYVFKTQNIPLPGWNLKTKHMSTVCKSDIIIQRNYDHFKLEGKLCWRDLAIMVTAKNAAHLHVPYAKTTG